ncbi:Neurotrypsin, partial [Bulinus truncatus]
MAPMRRDDTASILCSTESKYTSSIKWGTVQVFYNYRWGTVEIFYNYRWGTVKVFYNYRWGTVEVCYTTGRVQEKYFTTADGVQEKYFTATAMDVNENCLRINVLVAFISALYLETRGVDVRLVNGNLNYQGTVEVFYNNSWGAVCDDLWTDSAAQVVCSMLGHRSYRVQFVMIIGRLQQLRLFALCWDTEEKFDKYILLVHGGENYQGTVEVYYNNRWGTVCDDNWSDIAAQVVCSMLGYVRPGAVAVVRNGFNSTQYNAFWLDEVICSGNETSLFDCPHVPWGVQHCSYNEQAGVRCTPVCQSSFWKCVNGQCVTKSSLCDGVQDCTDNSDELNC